MLLYIQVLDRFQGTIKQLYLKLLRKTLLITEVTILLKTSK